MNGFGPHDDLPIGPEAAGWEEFVDDLQKMTAAPGEELAGKHIAAAAEAVKDVSADRRAGAVTPATPWRRRTVFASLFSSILGKVLVGSMAMAAATAGVGAAGALPEPVQEFVDDHVFQRSSLQVHERLQIQDQSGNLGVFADDNQVELQEQARVRRQEQAETQSQTQNGPGECTEEPCGDQTQTQSQTQNGPGECTEEPCGDQTQTQSQTQNGPGECTEEPCGDQTQTQSQTQNGPGECTEEPCGDQTQTQSQTQNGPGECTEEPCGDQSQTQNGPGECTEEPCGDQSQTQNGPGECTEEPCGDQSQTQNGPGECTEEPCEDPSQSKAQTQSGKR